MVKKPEKKLDKLPDRLAETGKSPETLKDDVGRETIKQMSRMERVETLDIPHAAPLAASYQLLNQIESRPLNHMALLAQLNKIEDPKKREVMTYIYIQMIGNQQNIQQIFHDGVKDIAAFGEVPQDIIFAAMDAGEFDDMESLEEILSDEFRDQEKAWQTYIYDQRKPQNLLWMDAAMSVEEMKRRKNLLWKIHQEYATASASDRKAMKEMLMKTFGITHIPTGATEFIDKIFTTQTSMQLEGAESALASIIHHEQAPRFVEVQGKGEQPDDFEALLKLMALMHHLQLELGDEEFQALTGQIDAVLDKDNALKLMQKPEFQSGMQINQLPEAIKKNPTFMKAFQKFLKKLQQFAQKQGVSIKPPNTNSEGVKVKLPATPNDSYKFIITDPGLLV